MKENNISGKIIAVSISKKRGEKKKNVSEARLIEDHGIEADAHAGSGHRQLSLLASESIKKILDKGLDVSPGDFAENITTEGIDLTGLVKGDRLRIGAEAVVEITQIGKKCHSRCHIYDAVGECVMPDEGVFAKVICGGKIVPGDKLINKTGKRDICHSLTSAKPASTFA